MKKLILLIASFFFALPVFAAPATDASVERLIKLSNVQFENELALAETRELLDSSLKPTLGIDQLPENQKVLFESFLSSYKDIIHEELNWKKMHPEYVRIYKEIFTEEEIQELIDFYDTPTGKMFSQKMPELTKKLSALNKQKMNAIMTRFNALFGKMLQHDSK